MNKLEVENKLKDNKLPEGWKRIKLGEVAEYEQPQKYIVSDERYDESIGIPVLTAGKSFILGYTDEQFGICKNLPVIIFDDFTTDSRYINFPFKLKSSAIKILKTRDNKYNLFFIYNVMQNLNFKPGSGHKRFWISEYSKISIPYPPLPEQKKIAEILETVDETIEKTDAIIEKYKRIKQGLMQNLLTRGITAFEFEKDKLIAAVKKVFDSGDHRFGREENLVSHLSRHLNEFFPGWNVDSEVEKNNVRQRPDIIIHKRRMDENLFAIEVKKNENLNAIKQDIEKLEEVMLRDYHYEDVVFIGFEIENFEDVFKLSEKVNFILVSKNGEIKVKASVRSFKDSPFGRTPEEWDVVNIKDICKVRQGLQIAIANRFEESGSKRYIYITIQYLNSEEKDKDAEYIQNPPKSVFCGKNDLLMTRTGNTGMVITDVEGVFHNNFFLVDYYKKQVNKIYLFYYLNLPWIQEEIKALAGTTTIPDLNHGDFYSLKFLKPPLPEQHRIASILSQIDETIEKEQKYKEKLERIKQGLMEDLLIGKVRVNHLIKEGIESV